MVIGLGRLETCDTYGRLEGSSTEVNRRMCDPLLDWPVGVELFSSPYDGASVYIGGSPGVFGLSIVRLFVARNAPSGFSRMDVLILTLENGCSFRREELVEAD
jgi:hypothetical protein